MGGGNGERGCARRRRWRAAARMPSVRAVTSARRFAMVCWNVIMPRAQQECDPVTFSVIMPETVHFDQSSIHSWLLAGWLAGRQSVRHAHESQNHVKWTGALLPQIWGRRIPTSIAPFCNGLQAATHAPLLDPPTDSLRLTCLASCFCSASLRAPSALSSASRLHASPSSAAAEKALTVPRDSKNSCTSSAPRPRRCEMLRVSSPL